MAPANYYELMHKITDMKIDTSCVGHAIASGVLDNASRHLELYFSQYPKEFKNKENKRVFISLEKILEGELPKYAVPELKQVYDEISGKTTQVVRKINFAYDAVNFFLVYNQIKREECPYDDLFDLLWTQMNNLGSQKTARRIRGMTKKSPDYHFGKSVMVNAEYDFFVKGLRNALVNRYGAPLE